MKTGVRVNVIVLVFLSLSLVFAVSAVDATAVVKVEPASQTVTPDDSFSVNVLVDDVMNMAMADVDLYFEPSAMQATEIVEGGFLKNVPGGGGTLAVEIKDNTKGIVTFGYSLMNPGVGASGSGVLAMINIDTNPAVEGVYELDLTNVLLTDGDDIEITVDKVSDGEVKTQPVPSPRSGTGMIAAISILAIALVISSMMRKRKK